MARKVWFITGASRGFGRIWAEAALARGDSVAVTARNLASITDLVERYTGTVLPLALDVTDPDQARRAVTQAHAHFGRLDIVLNNAGYTLIGTAEEASEEDVRALFDTNYFGTLRVIKAALPLLRAQGTGHIVGVSSSLGIAALPLIGFYCTTKWAIEALHESLAQEVKAFGIKVTLLEPGAYATDFGSDTSVKIAEGLAPYAELRKRVHQRLTNLDLGDPKATAEAVLQVVDAEEPPLRCFFGADAFGIVRPDYESRIANWEEWDWLAKESHGPTE